MAFMNEALQVQVAVFRNPIMSLLCWHSSSVPASCGLQSLDGAGLRGRLAGHARDDAGVGCGGGQVLIIALASFTLPTWLGVPMALLVEQFLVCS